jgi:hypothetical protein
MNLPEKTRKLLSLETDLRLTAEDFRAMSPPHHEADHDLAGYLIFLEAIGAFKSKKTGVKIYLEEFEL